MLTQVFNEIKISLRIYLLGIVISAVIICTAMIFSNLSECLMPAIYREYDENFEDGIDVWIYGMKLEQVDFVNSLNIKDFYFYVTQSTQISNSYVLYSDGSRIEEKEIVWLTDEECETYQTDEFNNSEGAIILCSPEYNKYSVGDEVGLFLKNKNIGKYEILRVVEEDGIEGSIALLPIKSVARLMDEAGYIIPYNASCVSPGIGEYIRLKESLSKENIRCRSFADEEIEVYSTLQKVFGIIAILFTIIAVIVLVVLAVININLREKYLVIQKVLGNSNVKIMMIYAAIIEMQIIISCILGCLIGVFYTGYLSDTVRKIYNFSINISYSRTWIRFLLEIGISNLALIPGMLVIKRSICKKEVAAAINMRE